MAKRILVTGAGGFIGHHLVKRLKAEGNWVRGADIKLPEYEASAADEFELLDLRNYENCLLATRGGIDQVGALQTHHFFVGKRLAGAKLQQRRKPHRGQARGLDRAHVPAGTLDAKDFDGVAVSALTRQKARYVMESAR